jgi:transcriptional regulator with XRE-family HTH domain
VRTFTLSDSDKRTNAFYACQTHGVTQSAVAERIGTTQPQVSRVFLGKDKPSAAISLAVVNLLAARGADYTAAYLFGRS